jgi:mannose-6-phosphate isomerase class I
MLCCVSAAGDAFFMGPNGPHAYISGDILECMALSDNTVRAGLSPKHKDVDTLLQMLEYVGKDAQSQLLQPSQLSDYTVLYRCVVCRLGILVAVLSIFLFCCLFVCLFVR